MHREFQPSMTSLIGSFGWDITPASVAAVGWQFASGRATEKGLRWLLLLIMVAMSLWSLFLIVQTIVVHLKRISVDERGLSIRGAGGGFVRYDDVAEAQLFERTNFVSRTDRLLTIRSNRGQLLVFNPSTLPRVQEAELLSHLGTRIKMVTVRDKPTL